VRRKIAVTKAKKIRSYLRTNCAEYLNVVRRKVKKEDAGEKEGKKEEYVSC
jgi:hypothetical protein